MSIKDKLPWADQAKIATLVEAKKKEIVIENPNEKIEMGGKKKKKKADDKDKEINIEEFKEERLSKLLARDLSSALNSTKLLEEHKAKAAGSVVTRFPPEPNGYLHIGHAKSMRHNFTLAEDFGGACFLRFDDTNPEKENQEYIQNIKNYVEWLGYKPYKITYASEYFPYLYECAIALIKKGKAFICHQTKQEMSEFREKCIESPYRNTPIEENLEKFEKMKQGRYGEKEACLRLKIDMKHKNPTMRDPVAYRIKFAPHPHIGDKWCIYPMYDFTHCISDSLEYITHSCCTLEFEIRRDLYYWILEQLDIYRAYVWEFSRLNISYNVMSKRILQSLVFEKVVSGWDDPRIMTLMGLKRRGVTPEAINSFCDLVGVTRRGNEMLISYKLLDYCIRKDLDIKAARTMTVLDPLEIIISNMNDDEEIIIEAPLFPNQIEKGKQKYTLTKRIFIEKSDYQSSAPKSFFGLTKDQKVLLKYAFWISLKEEIKDEKGRTVLIVNLEKDKPQIVPKGVIHWVSSKYSEDAQVRLYFPLFTKELPMKVDNNHPVKQEKGNEWKNNIDVVNSLKVLHEAKIWKNITDAKHLDRFQFERNGYFVVDYDSKPGKLVFNRTVTLMDAKKKKSGEEKPVKEEKKA